MTTILILSDLHSGSIVSLSPPEFTVHREDSNKEYLIKANKIQKNLFSRWEEMIDSIGNIGYTILLGDLVDGCNPKSHNNYTSMDIGDQVNMAGELLSMIKCSKFLGVQGTEYHVGHDGISCDRTVVAELCRRNKKKIIFDHEVFFNLDSLSIHAKHPGKFTSRRDNRPNVLLNEIKEAQCNPFMKEKFFDRDGKKVLLRGHIHYNDYLYWNETYNIYTPGWKGRDPYGIVKSNSFPECGYSFLTVDGGEVTEVIQKSFYAEDIKGRGTEEEIISTF